MKQQRVCVRPSGRGVFEKGKEDVKDGSQVCLSVNTQVGGMMR